jgi:hypothetical protein
MDHRSIRLGAAALAVATAVTFAATSAGATRSHVTGTVSRLSGLYDPTGASAHRSALTIKIDNTPQAHPQTGIDQADVVYEEIVEGQITRLASIFNSHVPGKVGPVRSVRRTDASIVWPIGGVFAYSGGAAYAVNTIKTAPVVLVDQSNANGAMYRDPTRYPPHNLYAVPSRLFSRGGRPVPPPAIFSYRTKYETLFGKPEGVFTVGFHAGYATRWHWNATTQSWDRDIFGRPDYTTTHTRISPKNVIVMWITYKGGVGTIGAEGYLYTTGRAWIFTKGKVIAGTWSRWLRNRPIVYRNGAGQIIKVEPGQTWVELLNVGDGVTFR